MMLSTHFSLEELILNQMIGGAKNSMHTLGLAADILSPAIGPPLQVCRAIARSGMLIDQVITSSEGGATPASRLTGTPPGTNYSPSPMPLPATSWVCAMCEIAERRGTRSSNFRLEPRGDFRGTEHR